jgi:hypothetical protein
MQAFRWPCVGDIFDDWVTQTITRYLCRPLLSDEQVSRPPKCRIFYRNFFGISTDYVCRSASWA